MEILSTLLRQFSERCEKFLSVYLLLTHYNRKYPEMGKFIKPQSNIVHSPTFELAVVKILRGEEFQLSDFERVVTLKLLKNTALEEVSQDIEASESVAQEYSRMKEQRKLEASVSHFNNLQYIPPTLNAVERLFSRARQLMGLLRCALTNANLEIQLFLMIHKDLWDQETVSSILKDDNDEEEVIID
ncbi:hypothetical protein GEMRC1_007951 [Eukaryota sp. GEM-RC1]